MLGALFSWHVTSTSEFREQMLEWTGVERSNQKCDGGLNHRAL